MRYVKRELHFVDITTQSVIFRISAARHEPLDQRLREAGGSHALLDDANIVGPAPKLDDLVLQVGDRKSGARIAVTRLSDRTGIQKIAARELDAQRGKGFAGAGTNLEDLDRKSTRLNSSHSQISYAVF